MTIARSLHDKPFVIVPELGKIYHEDGVYIFEDGSKATVVVRFHKVDPFLAGVVTSSLKEVPYWKAL
jgi:hypothetical protein